MYGVDSQGPAIVESLSDHALDRAIQQATDLIDKCLLALEGGDVQVADCIHLLRRAERRIGSLGFDKHLSNSTATALLAARDTLSAHLPARTMVTDGGVAPGVGRGLLRRG